MVHSSDVTRAKYQKHNTNNITWVDCTYWNEYTQSVSLWYAYRAIDGAGNEGEHTSVPVKVIAS